jgi:hypothetical protein
MSYPKAFVFVDYNTQLPPLETLRKWFGKKMASHVYAKDFSFQDKQVDDEVELMTRLYHYVSGNPAAVRCIVVSTSRINCLAQEALTENWRGLLWIDSDQHFEDLQIVERAVTAAENFSEGIDDLSTLYDQLVAYIREDTGQGLVHDVTLDRVFQGRLWGFKTEMEIRIRQRAHDLTRPGILWRIDLDDNSHEQAAA